MYHDIICASCSLPPDGFALEGSTSVELSESEGGIFRIEPCTLHPFSSFPVQKHHRNSLLPPQEIICKSFLIYRASCYMLDYSTLGLISFQLFTSVITSVRINMTRSCAMGRQRQYAQLVRKLAGQILTLLQS